MLCTHMTGELQCHFSLHWVTVQLQGCPHDQFPFEIVVKLVSGRGYMSKKKSFTEVLCFVFFMFFFVFIAH